MKELLIVPVFMLIILGFATQLTEIAESSSEKALDFAQDMNNAMDCAKTGRLISECSPTLFETDFDSEMNKTVDILRNIENISVEILNSNESEEILNL